MSKYRVMLQEYFRAYDNPLTEEISKLILSYLKFYGYESECDLIRSKSGLYEISFTNRNNLAVLKFGEEYAVLVEYDGLVPVYPLCKMDFIKGERLEYLGNANNRSIVYTKEGFSKSFFYGPNNYIGMNKADYLNNNIRKDIFPDEYRDLSEYDTPMMRIVASADFANEMRSKRFNPPAYYGRQF